MQTAYKPPKHVSAREFSCSECPLRGLKIFRDFTPAELKFVDTFKAGELRLKAGATLLHEGDATDYLYTLLSGWMYRYKSLPDPEICFARRFCRAAGLGVSRGAAHG
jgi:hypothetical protein